MPIILASKNSNKKKNFTQNRQVAEVVVSYNSNLRRAVRNKILFNNLQREAKIVR